jgi:hypothetical protein
MLLLVTWTAVASAFRYLLPPSGVGREVVTMLVVFVVLALGMTVMLLRGRNVSSAPGGRLLPRESDAHDPATL